MRGPYGFEMNENCQTCKLRKSGYFCQLQGAALKNFDAAKASSVYPEGAVLFIEKQEARGVFVLCEGQVKLSISSARREDAHPAHRQARRSAWARGRRRRDII